MKYWLMKSEPDVFSIDDLKRDRTTKWEGVRNYQARNFMMRDMQIGDLVLFYHSNAKPSGVAGIAKVCSKAFPDLLAQDPKSEYYDKKASTERPIWFCVSVEFVKKFPLIVSLDELRKHKALAKMQVLMKGQRLSIQPVTEAEFRYVESLGKD